MLLFREGGTGREIIVGWALPTTKEGKDMSENYGEQSDFFA
jgi:hypothetical protein